MANVLELLRAVLSSDGEQARFAQNPHAYLTGAGFGDLTGEDVVQGVRAVRASLDEHTAAALTPYERDEMLPPTRPDVGESDLDAAVRQLRFAISLTPGATVDGDPVWLDDPEPEEPPMESDAPNEADPAAAEATAPPPPPPPAAAVDPYAAFGEELAAIIRHAGEQMEEVLRRAEEQAGAIIQQAEAEADVIRRQAGEEALASRHAANEEASAIRAGAEVDAQNLRQNATQEADAILQAAKSAREEARVFKQSARDEANAILQSARSTQEDAQRQAAELIKSAERESSAMLAEARTRRDEVREAERELRNRLSGLETVFRGLQEGSPPAGDEG